jgi:hypothetical protein
VVRDPSVAVSLDALPKPPPRTPKAKQVGQPESGQSSAHEGSESASASSSPKKRRVNTSSKGTAIELAAIKVLEAEGYKVHRCVRTGVKRGPIYISQSNDVFGCIDLVAKKKGTRTRWIQVTADGGIGRKKADLAEVPWDPHFDSVEIWRWVGGQNRKHKTTGAFLERQYFQVYHLDQGYVLDKDRRIPLVTPAPTPGGSAT